MGPREPLGEPFHFETCAAGDHPRPDPMAWANGAHPGSMPTRREGPCPTLRLRVATWLRHHVTDDDPDQSRSGWDELDAVDRPDDGSVTDATDGDVG